MNTYALKIGQIERNLPIVSLTPKVKVASFNLLGDTELVEVLATKLLKKIKNIDFDFLVGPEVKVVPLLQALSQLTKKRRYVVCRKQIHGYMVSPIKTGYKDSLVINGEDVKLIKGKKVIIVDDVVTTGRTIYIVEKLMEMAEAKVVGKVALFKQGERLHKSHHDLVYLRRLPVFED
jgi:adenine phosphoribosyltransferase